MVEESFEIKSEPRMQRLGLYALVLTLLAFQAEAVSVSSFFSYGERVVPRGQTASSLLQLSNSFRYNDLEFNSIYVSVIIITCKI